MSDAIVPGTIHRPSDLFDLALRDNVGGGLLFRLHRKAALEAALGAAEELGILYVRIEDPDDAPKDLLELNAKFGCWMRKPVHGSPYTTFEGYAVPVSGLQNPESRTVWGEAGNALFRSIHETIHYRGQYDFDKDGEWHVCRQELAIYSRHADPEYRDWIRTLIEAETWGQTGFFEITESFPVDQVLFHECYQETGNPKDATYRYLGLI